MQPMLSAPEKVTIAWAWLTSFLHRNWRLEDYPVRVRPNGDGVPPDQAWFATILNWPGPAGVGATKDGALATLSENLEGIRKHRSASGRPMPRPGTKVPIEFAATTRVLADPALYDDFIIRVLRFEPGSPVFISDESSLGDFGDEVRVNDLRARIFEVYQVDVADLKAGLLCEILERIRDRS